MNIFELLDKAVLQKASDLHLTAGAWPTLRINGKLQRMGEEILSSDDTKTLIEQFLTANQLAHLNSLGELDFAYTNLNSGRFRVNAYKQRDSYALAIRMISSRIPSMGELGLPPILKDLAMKQRGLILVTGPTGSGKTTTLAAMLDFINKNRQCHILTLEDPIEYQHKHNQSIVNQREIGTDTQSFGNALRAALRQDPDVVLVGEMRDLETISIALTAAETGHLVLSTLHTIGAAKTIDRVIDVFPPHQQEQIRVQLASVLEAIISQQLMPTVEENRRVAAHEIMIANTAVKNLIREGKAFQIQNLIQTGSKLGMQSMDYSLSQLCKQLQISRQTALEHSVDRDMLERFLGGS
ncbi:MAG TPA: type IV pilus twitching motility protein PilT [Patescibacteria group bacterium]|jgi:twitching motility protein PilT|nr:type IV pilus twitching motility protein PilT [Patescibacteria group bacterium]